MLEAQPTPERDGGETSPGKSQFLPKPLDLGGRSKVYPGAMSRLTVSKLAERAGASPDILRYYEHIGLLPEADRSPSGYRLYDDSMAELVGFIKRAQRFGLRLEEIRFGSSSTCASAGCARVGTPGCSLSAGSPTSTRR